MTRKGDIERLLRAGARLRGGKLLDARLMDSTTGFVRVGIIVPRHGATAVRRNRLKRQLRELARREMVPLKSSRDVLLRARREAYDADLPALRDAIVRVASAVAAAPRP